MYRALGSVPAPHKLGVVYACKPSIREVEAEQSEVQGYPLLDSKFEVSLGYRRHHTHREQRVCVVVVMSSSTSQTADIEISN